MRANWCVLTGVRLRQHQRIAVARCKRPITGLGGLSRRIGDRAATVQRVTRSGTFMVPTGGSGWPTTTAR